VTRERISSFDGQGQRLQQRGLTQEHEVVGTGKVLAEQAQFAQAIGGHKVSVINDGHEHFASAINAESFLDQESLAVPPDGKRCSPRDQGRPERLEIDRLRR
jgi:hypothetical protein